jgi:hypothetical protein
VKSLLAIYLEDHHAAGVAGSRLAARVAATTASERSEVDLSRVAQEIAEDLAALESLMRRLGAEPNTMKDTIARVGERLGRLKPNGRLRERSPLSDLLELEALAVGITGKRALWVSMRNTGLVPAEELDRLIERAEDQHRIVESAREAAARRALEGPARSRPVDAS